MDTRVARVPRARETAMDAHCYTLPLQGMPVRLNTVHSIYYNTCVFYHARDANEVCPLHFRRMCADRFAHCNGGGPAAEAVAAGAGCAAVGAGAAAGVGAGAGAAPEAPMAPVPSTAPARARRRRTAGALLPRRAAPSDSSARRRRRAGGWAGSRSCRRACSA